MWSVLWHCDSIMTGLPNVIGEQEKVLVHFPFHLLRPNDLPFIWSNITIFVTFFIIFLSNTGFGSNLHQLLGQNPFPSLAQPLSNLSNLCQFPVHFPSRSSINPDISWRPIIFPIHLTRSRFDTLQANPVNLQCFHGGGGGGWGLRFIGQMLNHNIVSLALSLKINGVVE